MSDYSIWLLEYGYCTTQPIASLVFGKFNAGITKIPFTFMIIKGEGRTIAIDTGYYDEGYGHELTVKFGVDKMVPIEKSLDAIGIKGEDVDTVILTHAHYDHAGGIKAFPNAKFYMQETEFVEWMKVLAKPHEYSFLTSAIDPNDIHNMIDLMSENRMEFVNGEIRDFLPGVDLIPIYNSHTYGMQVVTIHVGGDQPDKYVFTSDACYSYDNFGERDNNGIYRPVGFGVGSLTEMVRALDVVMQEANRDKKKMIITHEPAMWDIYPSKVFDSDLHVAEVHLAKGEKSRV